MRTLKEVRESKGVKQYVVAKHIGVSRQTYCGYENNPSSMSVGQARAVCEFLGCSITDIFFSEDVSKTNISNLQS